ncbi:conserved exported hypothetical protein [Paraburkholderia ribeironis]|uniref:Uncharacterized protein n=1 Tax=Paraburkholderia ribeironis TaxID=1247936 RepID=A0A1N7S6D0_9BURK|nr:hypothetical protein [Paraburkholderia ribeironis]SIT42879.1 conserved exported hypothetical protein [Paraburkholderia ribeironis]
MTNSIRLSAAWIFVAVTTCALPAFAQNNAAPAARDATAVNRYGYGTGLPAAVDRRATNRYNEQQFLGAPAEYGSGDTPQGDTDDAQRTALLDEQRMTVTAGGAGAQRAPARAQRKAPAAAANGQVRVAGQPGRPTAAEGLLPQGAAKNAYADPYASKHAIYRSPW